MTRSTRADKRDGPTDADRERAGNLRVSEPSNRSIWLGRLLVLSLVLAAMLGTFLYFFGVFD